MDKLATERPFLEYIHGYPGEPDWLTAMIYGTECDEEPDILDMKQVCNPHKIVAKKQLRWNQQITCDLNLLSLSSITVKCLVISCERILLKLIFLHVSRHFCNKLSKQ